MDDWYASELPLRKVLATELRRLERRARARWPLVLIVAGLLTAAVVWAAARRPQMTRARVVLAVNEGELAGGYDPRPLGELRDYVAGVLLSNERLLPMIHELGGFDDLADEDAITELRDMFEIAVWRNYFQYEYSYEDRRSARLAVIVTHPDAGFGYDLAQRLAAIIMAAEDESRAQVAAVLAEQTREVQSAARARVDQAREALAEVTLALAEAETLGDASHVAVLRLRATELALTAMEAEKSYLAVEQSTSADSLAAQVTAAGLALQMDVVDARKPPRREGGTTTLIMIGVIALILLVPMTGIAIGAFDTRIHDTEDLARLQVPVLGHVPGFRGDHVGALRERGVPARRGAWLRRWR